MSPKKTSYIPRVKNTLDLLWRLARESIHAFSFEPVLIRKEPSAVSDIILPAFSQCNTSSHFSFGIGSVYSEVILTKGISEKLAPLLCSSDTLFALSYHVEYETVKINGQTLRRVERSGASSEEDTRLASSAAAACTHLNRVIDRNQSLAVFVSCFYLWCD